MAGLLSEDFKPEFLDTFCGKKYHRMNKEIVVIITDILIILIHILNKLFKVRKIL
ncbi:hypothetical protein SAMN05661044_02420 [Olivibacter domesticus]|uniref:Uncharacterized protein n=1 Tax=Olivibacter domesticus TaxID=407022 RepID=A0A1H7Q0V2_OLID1|nr:hypothetical protein SAMN05661044_02420 [Olivibacter domesticus]